MTSPTLNSSTASTPSKDVIIGQGVPFDRIRRITGYCSKFSRWNDAKKAEGLERVKHA